MRKVYLFDDIDSASAQSVIEEIDSFNMENDKPIELVINSMGGSVYDGFAILDAMRGSKAPVNTHVTGSCMSMAFIVFLQGRIRTCGKYATFMHHESSLYVDETLSNIRISMDQANILDEMCTDVIINNTEIEEDMLKSWNNSSRDIYINPREALALGIVHDII